MDKRFFKICIFFALKREAKFLLHHSSMKFTKVNNNHFTNKFENKTIDVFIVGVGKERVSEFFARNPLVHYDLTIKAGIACIIDESIPLLYPFIPKFIAYKNKIVSITPLPFLTKIKTDAGLITLDKVFYRNDFNTINTFIKKNIKFVDMETFHIHAHLQQNILPILVGSDYGINPKEVSRENIEKASKILSDTLKLIINITEPMP